MLQFYQNASADAGIKSSSIKSLEDIHKIPFTKKQDLRDGYPFGFFAVPLKKDCQDSYYIWNYGKTYRCRIYSK